MTFSLKASGHCGLRFRSCVSGSPVGDWIVAVLVKGETSDQQEPALFSLSIHFRAFDAYDVSTACNRSSEAIVSGFRL